RGLICPVLYSESRRKAQNLLRRNCPPRIRQRSCRRQALGRLGQGLERKESRRRKEHRPPSRFPRIAEHTGAASATALGNALQLRRDFSRAAIAVPGSRLLTFRMKLL